MSVREAWPDGHAALAAAETGDPGALAAVLRGLARLDGERLVEAALTLARTERGDLASGAFHALAHSRRDDALDALLRALDPESGVPAKALHRSVHPLATARIRSAFAATDPAATSYGPIRAIGAVIAAVGCRGDVESVERLVAWIGPSMPSQSRESCAEALGQIDDPRATEALVRYCSDPDRNLSKLCMRGLVRRAPGQVWDRFGHAVDAVLGGRASAGEVTLVSLLFQVLAQPWVVPPDQDPLLLDRRLVDAASDLRRHDYVGHDARELLRTRSGKAVARSRRPKPTKSASKPLARDFLARYEAGEHAAWDELVSHAVDGHPDLRLEAEAVARALMRRVRMNTDAVRGTLVAAGARLAPEAPRATDATLASLVALVGPLPVSLEVFWREVGSIALVPAEPYDYGRCSLESDGISLLGLDPLEICGADVVLEQVEQWLDDQDDDEDDDAEFREPVPLELAPDFLHKQNVSGGAPYAVELPPASPAERLDPSLRDHATTLVGYLRLGFAYGGFPLLEVASRPVAEIDPNDRMAFRHVRGPWGPPAERLLAALRHNLLPF